MAADYYVNGSTGSDSNNGSQSAPFRDFWPLTGVLKPGDTAHIASGNYYTGMYIEVSGQPGKPITIMGDSTNLPKIHLSSGYPIQFAPGVSYVNVKYFDLVASQSNKSGIWAGQKNHHLVIAYNVVHDCGAAGIGGWQSDYMTIRNNTVYHNSNLSDQDPSAINLYELSNYDTAVGFHNYIQDNIVYDNANKTPLAGHTYTTDGNGIIIDDSRHTQNAVGPAYTGTTLIENNVVFNNGGRGIHVYLSDNVVVRNNSVYHNNWDPLNQDYHAGEIEAYSSGNVKVYNNIMVSSGSGNGQHVAFSAQLTTGTSVFADNNLTSGSTAYYFNTSTLQTWGSHNKAADPQFVNPTTDPTTANFKVKSTSPALGLSNPQQAPTLDILNASRTTPVTNGAYQKPVS